MATPRDRQILSLVALCLLAAVALTVAQGGPPSAQCSVYKPQQCWYEVLDTTVPPTIPVCMAKHECAFNVTERLACPFYESGTFETVKSKVRRLRVNSAAPSRQLPPHTNACWDAVTLRFGWCGATRLLGYPAAWLARRRRGSPPAQRPST